MNQERIAGIVLAAAAAATVLAMAHHPTDAHASGAAALVHPAMIVLLLAIAWGFVQFAFLRGARNGLVSAGLVAFAVSVLGHVVAATINGFIVPALVNPAAPLGHDVFRFAWHANQAFAKLGVVAAGIAFLLWSIDLIRRGSTAAVHLGALGLVCGAAMVVIVAGGLLPMNVGGALLLYGLHALWVALVGVQMARGKLSPTPAWIAALP